jgi:hypothetical protein
MTQQAHQSPPVVLFELQASTAPASNPRPGPLRTQQDRTPLARLDQMASGWNVLVRQRRFMWRAVVVCSPLLFAMGLRTSKYNQCNHTWRKNGTSQHSTAQNRAKHSQRSSFPRSLVTDNRPHVRTCLRGLSRNPPATRTVRCNHILYVQYVQYMASHQPCSKNPRLRGLINHRLAPAQPPSVLASK